VSDIGNATSPPKSEQLADNSLNRKADPKKDLVDPAVIGTTGILKAIARSAPSVRRVVITSSFAAIIHEDHMADPNTTFNEKSWNPVTIDQIYSSPATAYRASKTLAEKAAWDFVADKSNGAKFDIATVNPPLVFGPLVHHLANLDSVNTSNQRFLDAIQGKWKNEVPSTGAALNWVDVRDVAAAHVKAGLEIPEAGGRRLFAVTGPFCNSEVVPILRKNFPELADKLPAEDVKGGEMPPENQRYKYDNTETRKLLGIKWISLEQSVVDTVKSLQANGA